MSITREAVKGYLRRLTVKEMVDICDEILQEGWEPRQVPMGWTFIFKSYSNKIRAIKVMRRILKCSMIEAQAIVDSFPYEISRESFCRNDAEMFKAMCFMNSVALEVRENMVEDPYDSPPTLRAGPMA
jgi:hypothetical protein